MEKASPSRTERLRSRRGRFLRHPADTSSALCTVLTLAGYALAFWLWHRPVAAGFAGAGERALLALGGGLLLGLSNGANLAFNVHNHVHRPIFRSARWNAWYGRLAALGAGWPFAFWSRAHRLHHEHLLGSGDWTLPRRRRDGRFEHLLLFALTSWPWRQGFHLARELGFRPGHRPSRETVRELSVFLGLWIVPFLVDPWMGLGLWLLPQWIANALVLAPFAYARHAGAEPPSAEQPASHANDFASPLFDLVSFHAGRAVVHYDHPGAHWSALPALHEREHARLVEAGVHVLPYGAFQAADVLGSLEAGAAWREFLRTQAPDHGTPAILRPRRVAPEAAPRRSRDLRRAG